MIQDFSPSSTRTPTEDSSTPAGRGTRFRSTSGKTCATDTCSFGPLAWRTCGASTFRFSRPEPQACARWWAASALRGGRLLLTNYESLTMAAQFPDGTLPQAHERGQVLSVSPGLYDCRIVQLSDPETGAPFEQPVSFIYELTRATSSREVWSELPWRTAQPRAAATPAISL
jgi:hypothetical protein